MQNKYKYKNVKLYLLVMIILVVAALSYIAGASNLLKMRAGGDLTGGISPGSEIRFPKEVDVKINGAKLYFDETQVFENMRVVEGYEAQFGPDYKTLHFNDYYSICVDVSNFIRLENDEIVVSSTDQNTLPLDFSNFGSAKGFVKNCPWGQHEGGYVSSKVFAYIVKNDSSALMVVKDQRDGAEDRTIHIDLDSGKSIDSASANKLLNSFSSVTYPMGSSAVVGEFLLYKALDNLVYIVSLDEGILTSTENFEYPDEISFVKLETSDTYYSSPVVGVVSGWEGCSKPLALIDLSTESPTVVKLNELRSNEELCYLDQQAPYFKWFGDSLIIALYERVGTETLIGDKVSLVYDKYPQWNDTVGSGDDVAYKKLRDAIDDEEVALETEINSKGDYYYVNCEVFKGVSDGCYVLNHPVFYSYSPGGALRRLPFTF